MDHINFVQELALEFKLAAHTMSKLFDEDDRNCSLLIDAKNEFTILVGFI